MKPSLFVLLVSVCVLGCSQTPPAPPVMPVQEMPAEPLAAGKTKKAEMTAADSEYIEALLEPFINSDAHISVYTLTEEPNTLPDAPPIQTETYIGTMAQPHFSVLAAVPYKVYIGEMKEKYRDFIFRTVEGAELCISITPKREHGVRIGGIALSAPDFHHYLHSLHFHWQAQQSVAEDVQH